jgi:hypothetical protein
VAEWRHQPGSGKEFLDGGPIPQKVVVQDHEYDASSAKEALSYAY